MFVRLYVGSRLGASSRFTQRLQAVGLADDHLRVLGQLRPVEFAFEKLRGAANAAQRVLDLVRKAADEVAVRLLLLAAAAPRARPSAAGRCAGTRSAARRRGVSIGDTVHVRCNRALPATPSSISCSVYDAPLVTAFAIAASSAAQSPKISRGVWPMNFGRDSSNRFSAAGFT